MHKKIYQAELRRDIRARLADGIARKNIICPNGPNGTGWQYRHARAFTIIYRSHRQYLIDTGGVVMSIGNGHYIRAYTPPDEDTYYPITWTDGATETLFSP